MIHILLQLGFIGERDAIRTGFPGRMGVGVTEHVRGKDQDVEGAWSIDQLVKSDVFMGRSALREDDGYWAIVGTLAYLEFFLGHRLGLMGLVDHVVMVSNRQLMRRSLL